MRAIERGTAVLAVALLGLLAPAVRADDAALHAEVRAALLEELGPDAMRIDIDVDGSTVELDGDVRLADTRERAPYVVAAVPGVTRVESDLELRDGPDDVAEEVGEEVTDAVLEARVKARIFAEMGHDAFDIEVEVSDGVVSLSGEADNALEKKLAVDTTIRTPGVTRVIDYVDIY